MDETRFRQAEAKWWAYHDLQPSERVLDLAATRCSVRVQEMGEGPPVVFIHGGSNSGVSWAPLVAGLQGHRCIVVDRPGCGLSAPLRKGFADVASFGAFGDAFAVDVMDAIGADTAPVVSTSFGSYLGIRASAAHPDRVSRLFACGYSIGVRIERVPWTMRLAMVPGLGALLARVPPTEGAVRVMLKQAGLRDAMANGKVPPEFVDCFLSLLRDTDTLLNEIQAGPKVITPIAGLNEAILFSDELLRSIAIPTYFLWGERDPFGGAETARRFVASIPDAELELMPGGHAVWVDDPDHVANALQAFL